MYKIDKKKIIFRNITQYELNQFTSQLQFISKRFKQHSLKNNSLCFIPIRFRIKKNAMQILIIVDKIKFNSLTH